MALIINKDSLTPGLTRREVAVMAGLAKNGRGRMSSDANRMLEKLEADGYVFGTPAATIAKEAAGKTEILISQSELELEPLRQWLIDNGHKLADRGRIAQSLINEYFTANPDAPRRGPVESKSRVAKNITRRNGVDGPKPVEKPTEAGAYFGPDIQRVHLDNFFEGYEYEYDINDNIVIGKRVNDSKGNALVKKSWKDGDAITNYSIAYVPGHVFAIDPRKNVNFPGELTPHDSDMLLVLQPAN